MPTRIRPRNHYTVAVKELTLEDCETLLRSALLEDAPAGDPTSEAIFAPESMATASIQARESGIFCGRALTEHLITIYMTIHKKDLKMQSEFQDGKEFKKNEKLLTVSGPLRDILRIERPLLNFLQYLSSISTVVKQAVDAAPENVEILDTRKTIPGYRKLAKYAVYCGGGTNHRITLSDMAMIKDNHIAASGSITAAVKAIRQYRPGLPVEVEIDNISQLAETLHCNPEVILLDNMNRSEIADIIEVIKTSGKSPRIEVSGGWKPEMLHELEGLGPLGVSMGFLTHTTRFLDLSLEMETHQ